MVTTIREARVESERIDEVERAFNWELLPLLPAIHETFLPRDPTSSSTFRIITSWKGQQALNQMREEATAAGEQPKGVQLFKHAGTRPALGIFNVLTHHS